MAPSCTQVSSTWNGTTTTQVGDQCCVSSWATLCNQLLSCGFNPGDWFVSSISQLQNPGWVCCSKWDNAPPAVYWSSTEINATKWNELVKISPVDVNVIESIIGVAQSCNLPEEFIDIIKDTLSHILDGTATVAQNPDWETFESLILQSKEMKDFITYANTINPLVSAAFPAAFFEVKNGRYGTFKIIWGELVKLSLVDAVVLGSIVSVAKSCDLPQEFIEILEG